MMNHTVPEFETDEDFAILELPMKSTMGGNEDTMELLWQNGQVVMQSQNQRSAGNKKPETRPMTALAVTRDFPSSTDETRNSDMFMQEDEMATWLHYPTDDISLENYIYGNDLIYPATTATPASLPPLPPPSVMISSKPPVPPHRHVEEIESGKHKTITDYDYGSRGLQLATIIATNETASGKASDSRASRVSNKPGPNYEWNIGGTASTNNVSVAGTSSVGWDMAVCETSVTPSSNSCDLGGAAMEPPSHKPPPPNDQKPTPTNDQKRKGKDIDDDRVSEDAEFENADAQKQSHGGSTSTKRSRATEVHNLSERRRRDRINEKMKELQELIPRCNKSDKASMLDEAIEYTKSLQMQVKMMSMGYNMVPMMYPGVQQYMPAMGMGMVPYPTMLPGSSVPNPAAATAHLGQHFPVPGFNMSPVTVAGPTTSQAANMSDQMMNTLTLYSQSQPTVPNFAYPFQEYLGLHQTQLPLPQNQGGVAPVETKKSTSKDAKNPDRQQTG